MTAIVPDVVTGEEPTEKPEGMVSPTLVTVPEPVAGLEFVIVIVPADCATVIPVPAAIVAVPPPAPPAVESVRMPDVVPDVDNVCASFVTDPSTSVPVMVKLG